MKKNIITATKDIGKIFINEIKLIFTDAGTVLIFLIALFIYPFLYAISYEKETIRELPVAVVDLDHTFTSRQYSRLADATEQLKVEYKPSSVKEAEQLFFNNSINGVLLIPENFEKDVLCSRQTNITVYCDASYFLLYKQVFSGIASSNAVFNAGIEIKKFLSENKQYAQAKELQEPITVDVYNLYNPIGGYGSFVMPGIVLIIMQQTLLIGIAMLGGTIREKRKFLRLTGPATKKWGSFKLVLGKASAYVVIYLFNAIFAIGILHKWFAYPDKANFLTILTLLVPYLFAISFLGLGISMLFKERVQSLLFMVFLSPMVLFLSGISWPTTAIPPILNHVFQIFPSSFMVPAYLKVRTSGANISSVDFELGIILIQVVVYFIFACLSYRYSIKKFGKKLATAQNR